MQYVLQPVLLILGFVLLVKGADWFVEGASAVAVRLGIPQIVIGLTIVAMGTSLPETAVSLSAALKNSAGIAVGNVIGSNILNILLILGVTATICPIAVKKSTTRTEIPFMVAVSIIFVLLGSIGEVISRWDGLVLWVLFLVYMYWLFRESKKGIRAYADEEKKEEEETGNMPAWKMIVMIILGAGMIVLGSDVAVDAATVIARWLGMSERLIGLTIVAIGTSLPELVTSVTAALKNKTDIAIGNIVGSNLFNILFVLGISSLITPIPFAKSFMIDSIFCIGSAILLLTLLVRDFKLQRSNGIIMLAAFAGYYTWLFLSNTQVG